MQPYQEATEEINRQGEAPFRLGKSAANVGLAAASAYYGGGLISKVAPWLSKYIPEDLMKKGLSKINPGFGKLIDKASAAGKSVDEIKEFIGKKMEEGEAQKEANQTKNIIEMESPELHQFLDQQIRSGRKPIEAGALAQNDKRFASIIQKLLKTHKIPWSKIIESVYGLGETAQPNQQQPQAQQPMQQQQQPGQGSQALMAILQKINQKLG